MKYKLIFLVALLTAFRLFSQESSQTFLSLKTTGVEDFIKANPTYDGRGTIVIVLDTGVDPGVDGLLKTTTGETKVIDVLDCTGEGDVKLSEAELTNENGEKVARDSQGKLVIKGLDKLEYKPDDDKYLIGNFNEERFCNSNAGIKDLNGNGKNDDNYIIIAFRTSLAGETFWIAYIDANADGKISDDKPLRSFREKQDTFQILNPNKFPYFTFALNIFPDEKLVNIFFDDGAHGTHCAGIAAGYQIGKSDNFNGVAPGAKVIGLKIGDNTNSGGATITGSMKKAYLYADKLSKERKEPCIINMSFGIGSVIEGDADMEKFLDDLLKKNPYLYVCVSNGNNGPGISTAGLPASSKYVFSSGAVLAQDVGRDDYGTSIKENIILHFSSRGGEVAKPDVCTPGAATSSVTDWSGGDKMWGTSMASPYSAGVMSLLLSAVNQKFAGVKIPSQLLFKAVRNSAEKMEGYTVLDYGGGFVNVPDAFKLLEKYINEKQIDKFQDYNVSSFAPNMPKSKAQCLYIRNGSIITENDKYQFNISRVNPDSKEKFYRIYNLVSDNDWLIPLQKKTYIRNNAPTSVTVVFDKTKMKEPGLYTGRITAYRDDKTKFPEFELQATVVIPDEFNSSNNYKKNWADETLMPGSHKRYFLNIPPGASVMTVKLSNVNGKYANVLYRLFDPDGVNVFTSPSVNTNGEESFSLNNHQALTPGVYELVVHGHFLATNLSTYNLAIEFGGVKPAEELTLTPLEGKTEFVNYFNQVKQYEFSGELLGFQKSFTAKFEKSDKYIYPFILRKGELTKSFNIEVSKEDFNKVTDFSLLIYDEKGNALVKSGLDYPLGDIEITNTYENTDSTNLKLVIIPAFVSEAGDMKVNIVETTNVKSTQAFQVQNGLSNRVEFYPTIKKQIDFYVPKPNFFYPKDSNPYGTIYLKSTKSDKQEMEFPFLLLTEGDK